MERKCKIGNKIFVKKTEYVIYENVEDYNTGKILYKTSNKAIFVSHKIKAIKEFLRFA